MVSAVGGIFKIPCRKNVQPAWLLVPGRSSSVYRPCEGRGPFLLSLVPFISKDRNIVGVDWFDVLMHCLKMGSTKWRRPVWCVSIGGHEKSHLAPEPGVSAAGGFEGPHGAGRWLYWCHIIHSAWPLCFKVSYTFPTPCAIKSMMAIKGGDQLLYITVGWYIKIIHSFQHRQNDQTVQRSKETPRTRRAHRMNKHILTRYLCGFHHSMSNDCWRRNCFVCLPVTSAQIEHRGRVKAWATVELPLTHPALCPTTN